MHTHDHDNAESETGQAKPQRTAEPELGLLFKAAARGRTDALGRGGMLAMQRSIGNAGLQRITSQRLGDEDPSPVLDVVSGGGRPLEEPVRADMEQRLGASFADVRIHDDRAAHDSAKAVNAHAYTTGHNIVFQRGMYDPGCKAGATMLAHELTHVVQQRSGPVDGTPSGNGVKVSDPGDRFEREASANAERVMSAVPPAPPTALAAQRSTEETTAAAPPLVPAVQRQAEGEEEEVQGAFVDAPAPQEQVQREEEEEEVQGSFVDAPVQREEEEEEAPA